MGELIKYEARNFHELLDAVSKVCTLEDQGGHRLVRWWRGQSDATWSLVPRVFRDGMNPLDESRYTYRFKNLAPVRYTNCPAQDSHEEWLYLMQHYSLPTRLLDWSELPLVAMFFALAEGKDGADGVLWGLDRDKLNQPFADVGSQWRPQMTGAGDLAKQAFLPAKSSDERDRRTIALDSVHFDIRHMVQGSRFTIHGTKDPLEINHNASEYLAMIRIKAENKKEMRNDLQFLGITRENLFPDLDTLGKETAKKRFL